MNWSWPPRCRGRCTPRSGRPEPSLRRSPPTHRRCGQCVASNNRRQRPHPRRASAGGSVEASVEVVVDVVAFVHSATEPVVGTAVVQGAPEVSARVRAARRASIRPARANRPYGPIHAQRTYWRAPVTGLIHRGEGPRRALVARERVRRRTRCRDAGLEVGDLGSELGSTERRPARWRTSQPVMDHGSTISMPVSAKSLTFRVASTAPCT